MRFLCLIVFFFHSLILSQAAVAQSPPFWPAANSEAPLDSTFAWLDAPKYASYYLMIRRADTKVIVHSANIDANDSAVCPNNGYCRLSPGMPAYPALTTIQYEWAVLGRIAATGASEWWQPSTFTAFHVMPILPAALDAEWVGGTLNLNWPPSQGAIQYRADILNVFIAPYSETYSCSTPVCSGTSDVGNIKFGTILVSLRPCGLHGKCTKDGTKAEAYRAPPNPIGEPNIVLPADKSTVKGMNESRLAGSNQYRALENLDKERHRRAGNGYCR